MSKSKVLNTFTGGIDSDSLPELTARDSYRIAVNAVDQTTDHSGFGISNELGNRLVTQFGGEIKGWSYIEDIDATLFFVYSGTSEIHLFYHKTETSVLVVSDAEFGCDWGFDGCEFLYAEFKRFNACEELHVYWSSDCVYHVVNIDEMLNPARKGAIPPGNCDYFQVFNATCSPIMNTSSTKFAGGMLEGGVVEFAVQFRDDDYNYSNIFSVSQPVYLDTDDQIPGQVANGAALLQVTGLSPKWRDVIVYVIHTVGGVETIKRMPARGSTSRGFTFEYYGQEGELVPPSTLYKRHNAFLRGKDLIQKDGRMYYYNTVREKNLNYQKYANQVQLSAVVYETTLEQQQRFHFPTLMRGEVYAPAIVWNYADGTHTEAFHMWNIGAGSSSGSAGVNVRTSREEGQTTREVETTDDIAPINDSVGTYKPMGAGDMDSAEQFERKRNPSELKDRPHESDSLEDRIETAIENMSTTTSEYVDAADCEGCTKECICCDCDTPDCCNCTTYDAAGNITGTTECSPAVDPPAEQCDCSVLKNQVQADIPDVESKYTGNADIISDFGLDDPDPSPTTGSWKAAAEKILNSVKEREYIDRTKPEVKGYTNGDTPKKPTQERTAEAAPAATRKTFGPSGTGPMVVVGPDNSAASLRGDNWVDQAGNSLTDEPLTKVAELPFEQYESVVPYPDDVDCEGERFYPEGNVKYIKVPDTSTIPHFYSTQNGVVNKYQPDNFEWGETYVRLIGIKASNIHIPTDDELPKPLCPNNPYSIVYVKRTHNNRRVFAKGWANGMFQGEVYGKNYLYPRHGVNSFETVDAMISPAGNPNSRKGSHFNGPYYNLHSPDTDADRSFLPITHVRSELQLRGSGWRHGLYAEGRKPVEDQWNGTRVDNLGARVSNNLNHFTKSGYETELDGISYAPGNTVVTAPAGMDYPLMNRYRESSVYFKTARTLQGDSRDQSFVGDVLDHYGPTICNAPYVSLIRDLPDQYGSVESLQYIKLGVEARPVHATGASIEGVCGDSWIGAYSVRRTSYVSNKKGDIFNVPPKPGSPCRERSICDGPDDKLIEYMGIDFYPTKLPKPGDKWDPKNYAGLHTISGECGTFGKSKTLAEAIGAGDSESDFYYPGTLKSLVTTVVESNINPYFLQTGEGPQIEEGKVYYPKLKDLSLDSDAPAKQPWEESFLNRFYKEIEQPSIKQRTLKALIRNVINLIVPVLGLSMFTDMSGVVDTVGTLMAYPLMSALWILATNVLFTDRRLNQLLGIDDCRRDEEGGDLDTQLRNWEDIYTRISFDYSKVNDFNIYPAFTLPYNTCDCDTCDQGGSDLVYVSNKQNPNSSIDSYRRAQLTHYFEIPSTAGRIQRLFKTGGRMFVHTTEGILPIQDQDGELIVSPQIIGGDIKEGIYGTHSPNAAINTPFGYFFIDEEAGKLYRFDGTSQPEEVSTYWVRLLMRKHISFCDITDCYDEKVTGTSYYSLGYDPVLERVLFTKNEPDPCSSFTMSYAVRKNRWVSAHTYKPNGYNWDRKDLYSILSNKGEVWKHHEPGNYGNFYGTQEKFMVEFVVRQDDMEDFRPISLDVDLEVWEGGFKDLDTFFDNIWAYNSTQSTGTRPVQIVSDNTGKRIDLRSRASTDLDKIKAHKNKRTWNINELQDFVRDDCRSKEISTFECDCALIPEANEEIVDCKTVITQDYQNRTLEDQFMVIRLEFSSSDKKRFHLKKVVSTIKTPDET